MAYLAEYTDTFGGEANYSWVRRATLFCHAKHGKRDVLRAARAALGLTGIKGDIVADYGDEYHWKPRGACAVLMVRWDETATDETQEGA